MRVLIDLQGAQTGSRFRGIGRYSLELTKGILRNSGDHEILILLNGLLSDSLDGIRLELKDLISPDRIFVWEGVGPTAVVDSSNQWRQKASELIRNSYIQSLSPDIILCTSLVEGYGDNFICGIDDDKKVIPVAAIFYDLIPLIYPKDYLSDSVYAKWYRDRLDVLKKANLILSISESSRKEAIDYLGFESDRIVNISSAASSSFPFESDDAIASKFMGSLGIQKPFLMYTSATDARKNHRRLIEAYGSLDKDIQAQYQLVFAGGMPKEHRLRFEQYAKKNGLNKKSLIFTGALSDKQLNTLYSKCFAFVFPSWHEGFGLPILEAMHFNKAVIASNSSSIPEIILNKQALFDPVDVASIKDKIYEVIKNDDFRGLLERQSEARKKEFSWDKTAQLAIQALEDYISISQGVTNAKPEGRVEKFLGTDDLISSIRNLKFPHSEIDLLRTANAIAFNTYKSESKQLLVDISVLVEHDAGTGIQRVVRNVLGEWLVNPPLGFKVEPVYATLDKPYRYARDYIQQFTGENNQPDSDEIVRYAAGDIFIGLDLLYPYLAIANRAFYKKMKNHGVKVKFIVYDLLPILLPHSVVKGAPEAHAQWLKVISESDGAICISQAVAMELRDWLSKEKIAVSPSFEIDWFHLGADEEVLRMSPPEESTLGSQVISSLLAKVTFLSVGTIEPRKGHAQLLSAFELLWAQGYDINLVLVGKQGWSVDILVDKLKTHPEFNRRLFWFGHISNSDLNTIYKNATCLIAASEGEGFGLPLIEAAHKKIPIIARNIPVFREVAKEHAFYFEGSEPIDLAVAVKDWLGLMKVGSIPSSSGMPWLTWKESALRLLGAIDKRLNS